MEVPVSAKPATPSDVLHSENHSRLTVEDIAKAVARHHREHKNHGAGAAAATPQKTTPRR
jgi:hypothetical protein